MKRVFIVLLVVLALLHGLMMCTVADADTVSPDAFLLKIRNSTTIDMSYLRFDLYFDEAEYADKPINSVFSAPQAGEDFYRCELIATHPEKMRFLRIELSYGVSELSPLDAVAQCWRGEPGEEHHLLTLDFTPMLGREYDLRLDADGEEWVLERV